MVQESEELLEMQKKFHREDMGNARTVDSDAAFKEASDAAMFRVHILEKRLHRYVWAEYALCNVLTVSLSVCIWARLCNKVSLS